MLTNAGEKERWLEEARGDFTCAEVLLEAAIFNASAFHGQQCAEKALKSVLHGMNLNPWGHSILGLLQDVVDRAPIDNEDTLKSNARILDRHYLASRYPNVWATGTAASHYDAPMALEAIQCANRILEVCERL